MFFDRPIWIIGSVVTVMMFGAAEIGFHIGRRNTGCDSGAGTVKASVLALSGLLLAFSYSMAAGHYDLRVQAVVREAKALKTCWLRTDLASEPARSRARELLRSIVDERLLTFRDPPGSEASEQAAQTIANDQLELWEIAAAQLAQSREPEKHVLLAQSTNDLIERIGEHASAIETRVPNAVVWLLILNILVAGFLIGFSSGQDTHRVPILWTIVLMLMVVVLLMIFDLDDPGHGVTREPYKPLEEVRTAMRKNA